MTRTEHFLSHQHVVNELEGLRADADAAAIGIVHDEQEMDLHTQESGENGGHPEMHGEAFELEEPADREAEHRSKNDKVPQRTRQMRGDGVTPYAALLDKVVEANQRLRM